MADRPGEPLLAWAEADGPLDSEWMISRGDARELAARLSVYEQALRLLVNARDFDAITEATNLARAALTTEPVS